MVKKSKYRIEKIFPLGGENHQIDRHRNQALVITSEGIQCGQCPLQHSSRLPETYSSEIDAWQDGEVIFSLFQEALDVVHGNDLLPFSQQDRAEQNTALNMLVICSEHGLLSPRAFRLFHLILAFLKTRKWIGNSHTAMTWLFVPSSCHYLSCHWQYQFKEKTLKF